MVACSAALPVTPPDFRAGASLSPVAPPGDPRAVPSLQSLQAPSGLGPFLEALGRDFGPYDVVDHWQQGEFHHDLVLKLRAPGELPAPVVVVATNCNAGIKEVLWFDAPPDRWALWGWRCPGNPEFGGQLPELKASWRKEHWFDPCELLSDDARSELQPGCRRRARGGGWEPVE